MSVFSIETGINGSEILTKHISYERKCIFDGRKCNSNQKWDNYKYRCEYKNPKDYNACEKYHTCNPTTCSCENAEYLTRAIDYSAISCNEIINGSVNFMR